MEEAHLPRRTEWPTVALAVAIHGGWLLLTFVSSRMPFWMLLAPAAWLVAWHMSLQHEVIHGHPTRHAWLNDLIGSIPLSLWLPYNRYKQDHLGHHRSPHITDPVDDPESHYVSAARHRRMGPVGRGLMVACNTLLGRVVLGPARGVAAFLLTELPRLRAGQAGVRRAWVLHLFGSLPVLGWLHYACHLGIGRYLLLFVYPGYALALIRSFAEHRAAADADHRTAVVERAPVLGVLFLFNNLHLVHHLRPGLPWYRIPAAYRAGRPALLVRNNNLVYRGYGEVARRFLLRPHDSAVHPVRG